MTLSTLRNRESYLSGANQTSFDFTIDGVRVPFFANSDIKVFKRESGETADTPLSFSDSPTNNTQFSITAVNNDTKQGGTIVIGGTGYAAGTTITIERIVPFTQEFDLQEGSAIDPTALNTALDRAVAQTQQLDDDRVVTFPASDASSITYNVTESATSRANKVLGFDSSGNINTQTFSTVAGDAVTGGNGIDITANQVSVDVTSDFTFNSGELQLATDSVDTAEIKANAVDTAEIKDNAVTTAKLPDSTSTSDGVTLAKLQHIATDKVLGRTTASDGDVELLDLKDEDNMASNSDTAVATQQSIKAYIDTISGLRVGRAIHINGTTATTITTTISLTDTAPTLSDGSEVCTVNYTPTSTSNLIRMTFTGRIIHGLASKFMTAAFFEGSTCKQAFLWQQPSNGANTLHYVFEFNPASTSSTTYSVRVGMNPDGTPTGGSWSYSAASDTNYDGLKQSPTLLIEEWNT